MAASGTLVLYRVVFAALDVLMVGTLVYTCITDGPPFRPEFLTPWMVATLADFYVNVVVISTWVIYKEVNWISSVFWVVLLFCFGSAATCAYIVKKLFDITSSGPSQDPLDLLLLRQDNLSQRKCSFVIIGRIVFSILGVLMAAVVIYTVIIDGLPFRKDLLTPWMAATLIDFYINVFAILWTPPFAVYFYLCMGCSQGVELDIISHLDMLVDMLRKHHNMLLHRCSTFPSVIPRPNLPCACVLLNSHSNSFAHKSPICRIEVMHTVLISLVLLELDVLPSAYSIADSNCWSTTLVAWSRSAISTYLQRWW